MIFDCFCCIVRYREYRRINEIQEACNRMIKLLFFTLYFVCYRRRHLFVGKCVLGVPILFEMA